MTKRRQTHYRDSMLMRTRPKLPPPPPPNCQCPACVYREMIEVIAEACHRPKRDDRNSD